MTSQRVAIIPARGGSKRIPRKNIKPFCGKPMIAWPIETALASGLFDEVIVSTDDEDIAAVAQEYGARAPFRRPEELANDRAATQPVIAHAIDWLLQHERTADAVCCLYATAPFVTRQDLQAGWQAIQDPAIRYAFAATSFAFPIQRGFYLDAQGRPQLFQPEHAQTRSQDLPEAFHDAGQFYWARAEVWRQDAAIFGPDSRPVMLPRQRVQDIDTPEDWQQAETLMRVLQQSR